MSHDNIDDKEIDIDGYNTVRLDRKPHLDGTIKRGGGEDCVHFVKNGIIFENLNDLQCSTKDIEMDIIKLKLPFT